MMHLALVAAIGVIAGAQQPAVNAQELPKPGQAQSAQPAKPAPQPVQQPAPAPQAAPAQAQQQQPAPQPQAQPVPAPAPAPVAAPTPSAVAGQHVPAPEETERGKQGKPVGAFWTVIPGK